MNKSQHVNAPEPGEHGFQKTHGLRKAPEYNVWNTMKMRCHTPTALAYPRYGARGITVCDRWRESFVDFLADMGPRPSPNHSIERIDNDKGYNPSNCRWATLDEQANNKRRTVYIAGKTISEIAAQTGLSRKVIENRVYRGMSEDEIMSPIKMAPGRKFGSSLKRTGARARA